MILQAVAIDLGSRLRATKTSVHETLGLALARASERGTPVITPADWWNQATSHFVVESVRINTGLLISPCSRPIRAHTAPKKQPEGSRVEKARIRTGSLYVI